MNKKPQSPDAASYEEERIHFAKPLTEDDVLLRMLKTKPKPHKPATPPAATPKRKGF